jgi:hypothetical protein
VERGASSASATGAAIAVRQHKTRAAEHRRSLRVSVARVPGSRRTMRTGLARTPTGRRDARCQGACAGSVLQPCRCPPARAWSRLRTLRCRPLRVLRHLPTRSLGAASGECQQRSRRVLATPAGASRKRRRWSATHANAVRTGFCATGARGRAFRRRPGSGEAAGRTSRALDVSVEHLRQLCPAERLADAGGESVG